MNRYSENKHYWRRNRLRDVSFPSPRPQTFYSRRPVMRKIMAVVAILGLSATGALAQATNQGPTRQNQAQPKQQSQQMNRAGTDRSARVDRGSRQRMSVRVGDRHARGYRRDRIAAYEGRAIRRAHYGYMSRRGVRAGFYGTRRVYGYRARGYGRDCD